MKWRTIVNELTAKMLRVRDNAIDSVARETINWLRSADDEQALRPPARRGEGSRRAHPGGWADISGNLQSGYNYNVTKRDDVALLVFENKIAHAKYVEGKEKVDGGEYWVLSGILEEEKSPIVANRIQQLMTEALR